MPGHTHTWPGIHARALLTLSPPLPASCAVRDVDGRRLASKTVSVNQPLRVGGVTASQTDWSMAALTLRALGSPLQPPGGQAFKLPMASLAGEAAGAPRHGAPADTPRVCQAVRKRARQARAHATSACATFPPAPAPRAQATASCMPRLSPRRPRPRTAAHRVASPS